MPSIQEGKYTIKEIILLTDASKYKNRFTYMKRDLINTIYLRKIKKFDPKDLDHPTYLLEFISTSTPQYKPYLTVRRTGYYKKGKKTYERKSQRLWKHRYNVYLRIYDKYGSINTKAWKIRLGEDKKWRKFSKQYIRSKKNPQGKYLNQSDANSRILGLNGDWIFLASYFFREANLSYNCSHTGWVKPKKGTHIFFPKHCLALINLLLQAKILVDEPLKDGEV